MVENRLTASYRSENTVKDFSSPLPSLPEKNNVQEKTSYLAALRSNIKDIQRDVNVFLTQEMEAEKTSQSGTTSSRKSNEEQEEEMYGEEDPEGDA